MAKIKIFISSYIERMGTGTTDMIRKSFEAGLAEPQFIQSEDFRTILFRKSSQQVTDQVTPQDAMQDAMQVTMQVTDQVTDQVKALILLMEREYSRYELMGLLQLKHNQTFRDNYLNPSLTDVLIEMTQPNSPNSPTQKYRLTAKGEAMKELLKNKNN